MDFDPNLLPLGQPDSFWLNPNRKRLEDIIRQPNVPTPNLDLGLRGINFQQPLGIGMLNGNVGFNGDYGLKVQHPFLGGLLSLGVNGGHDQDTQYKLGYKRKF
jgi:hypothetical protein